MGLFSRFKGDNTDISEKIGKTKKNIVRSKNIEKDYHDFLKLVNKYFESKYHVHYKFTYEDLKYELLEIVPDNLKPKVSAFCNDLNELEFDKQKITAENIIKLADKLEEISNFSEIGSEMQSEKKIELNTFSDEMFAPPGVKEAAKEVSKEEVEEKKPESDEYTINVPEPEKIAVLEPEKVKIRQPEKIIEKSRPEVEAEKIELEKPKEEEPSQIIEEPKIKPEPAAKKTKPRLKAKKEKKKTERKKSMIKPIEILDIDLPKKEDFRKPQEPNMQDLFEVPKLNPLPSFKIQKDKAPQLSKDLEEIIKDLKLNKKEIKKELEILDEEKKLIKKEKKVVGKKDVLPAFKVFNKQKEDELRELAHKKELLIKKEKLIDKKLNELQKIEVHLTDYSKGLKKDKAKVKSHRQYVKSKEKVIKKIKKDLEKNYTKAMAEIKNMRKDLKEKEDQFLGLQDFFKKRENKLSVEEANLLDEKRRHMNSVAVLIKKHLEIAKQDLAITEHKLKLAKKDDHEADKRLKELDREKSKLQKQKQELVAEFKDKKDYFVNSEKEIRSRDSEFVEMRDDLVKRQKDMIQRETKLVELEDAVSEAKSEIRKRTHAVDIKEIEIRGIEKEVSRLRFDIKNHYNRLEIREKQFEKRNGSLERIRTDIKNSISREKQGIKRIEARLRKKGYKLDEELEKVEKQQGALDKGFDAAKEFDLPEYHDLARDDDVVSRHISITHELPESEIGNPYVLDILRLVNKAKVFLQSGHKQQVQDVYLEIQRLFDNLNEAEREEVYPQVTDVFRSRAGADMSLPAMSNSNIDVLIHNFENSIIQGDIQQSGYIYNELQQKYEELPQQEKPRYFNKIMTLYNKISAV